MKRIVLYILLIIILIGSCAPFQDDEFHHHVIPFNNESDKLLYVDSYVDYYKDISFKSVAHQVGKKVHPNSGNIYALNLGRNSYWESRFGDIFDTIWVYVLDAEKIDNAIYGYDAVLQCYGLTLSDLRRLKWIVTYPPTPEMKDIKMFPAYCEKPICPIEEDEEISTN